MRQTLALVVSVVLGAIAVIAMKSYIDREKSSTTAKWEMVQVVVAKRQLRVGTKIAHDDVAAHEIPAQSVTPDMIPPGKVSLYVGREIGRTVDRGGFIMESDFARPSVSVSAGIPAGKRLLSIPVDQVSGVSGLIKPSSRVEVYFTVSKNSSRPGERDVKTVLLLSSVAVHAVDERTMDMPANDTARRAKSYTTVTLVVTPQEAALLASAQDIGHLTLALRPPEEGEVIQSFGAVGAENIEAMAREANQIRRRMQELESKK